MIYRVIRFFNVSIWIYVLPTLALIAQFAIPFYYKTATDDDPMELPVMDERGEIKVWIRGKSFYTNLLAVQI